MKVIKTYYDAYVEITKNDSGDYLLEVTDDNMSSATYTLRGYEEGE